MSDSESADVTSEIVRCNSMFATTHPEDRLPADHYYHPARHSHTSPPFRVPIRRLPNQHRLIAPT
jgi:hypothetical protein